MLSMHDAEFIERLRSGDEQTFTGLVASLGPRLLRVARQYVKDDATAEEVVQETWIAVLHGLQRFAGMSSLTTWITAITVNKSMTRGKREARIVPFSSLAQAESAGREPAVAADRFAGPGAEWPRHWENPLESWSQLPEAALLAGETRAILAQAVAALPTAQGAVIRLRDIAGYSGPEIAQMLELSEANVRVLLHRGRSKLRATLEGHFTNNTGASAASSAGDEVAVRVTTKRIDTVETQTAEIMGTIWRRMNLIVRTWSKWSRIISKAPCPQAITPASNTISPNAMIAMNT